MILCPLGIETMEICVVLNNWLLFGDSQLFTSYSLCRCGVEKMLELCCKAIILQFCVRL